MYVILKVFVLKPLNNMAQPELIKEQCTFHKSVVYPIVFAGRHGYWWVFVENLAYNEACSYL